MGGGDAFEHVEQPAQSVKRHLLDQGAGWSAHHDSQLRKSGGGGVGVGDGGGGGGEGGGLPAKHLAQPAQSVKPHLFPQGAGWLAHHDSQLLSAGGGGVGEAKRGGGVGGGDAFEHVEQPAQSVKRHFLLHGDGWLEHHDSQLL